MICYIAVLLPQVEVLLNSQTAVGLAMDDDYLLICLQNTTHVKR